MGLEAVRNRVEPVVLAGERRIDVSGPLGGLLPRGGLQRGTVVAVDGSLGGGVTSLVLQLVAAATTAGEWAAVVDLDATFGGLAAVEAGAAPDRLAVVRGVTPDRWARVVAQLLEGLGLVAAAVPRHARAADARRLAARARERSAVLVVWSGRLGAGATGWPAEAALRLRADESGWRGLGAGDGFLAERRLRVAVSGRGLAGRERPVELAS